MKTEIESPIEFTDDDLIVTLTALNDFIVTATMLKNSEHWEFLPPVEQAKYLQLIDRAVDVHEKLLVLYRESKRSFQ